MRSASSRCSGVRSREIRGMSRPSMKKRSRDLGDVSTASVVRNFPPTIETPTQSQRRPGNAPCHRPNSGNRPAGPGPSAQSLQRSSGPGGGRTCWDLGRSGRRRWNLGSPFFPLVQSGFDGPGSDRVDAVSDLELGLAKDLAIGLGGEQLGDALDFVLDNGHETELDAVGLVSLLGGQVERDSWHEPAFHEETVKRFGRRIDSLRCTKFSTYNRDAHPSLPDIGVRKNSLAGGGACRLQLWHPPNRNRESGSRVPDARRAKS